ncbi:MAG: hypothetical protein FWB77_04180 [Treponema sp.]|nr:hypothetical protein [Treponema sp.]
MSKSALKSRKKAQRQENAVKKARNNKLLFLTICALIVICAAMYGIYSSSHKNKTETYSDGGQTIQLLSDGKFSASLAHNNRKAGTFTKITENGRIKVIFNTNGTESTGWIINDALHFPEEWEDGHHHGNALTKTK